MDITKNYIHYDKFKFNLTTLVLWICVSVGTAHFFSLLKLWLVVSRVVCITFLPIKLLESTENSFGFTWDKRESDSEDNILFSEVQDEDSDELPLEWVPVIM